MEIRSKALKTILKRKLDAEALADEKLTEVLRDEEIKILFVACKKLIVDIAKLEVDGKDSKALKDEYNKNRELISDLLKQKGFDKKDLKPNYSCEICKDSGVVNGVDCKCLKTEMSKELIHLSGIDMSTFARFNDDFSCFENAKEMKVIYNKMKDFVLNFDKTAIDTILFVGDTGVGKTHLMECMTTFALEKGLLIKYTTAFNFNHDMLRYHCSKLEEKEDLIEPYLDCDLLFLDDLGSENKIKNVTNEYLYLVLNERMLNHKKTIISTNLSFEQIQDVYGERIFSRMMHKKQSLKIKIEGKDLRLNVAKPQKKTSKKNS